MPGEKKEKVASRDPSKERKSKTTPEVKKKTAVKTDKPKEKTKAKETNEGEKKRDKSQEKSKDKEKIKEKKSKTTEETLLKPTKHHKEETTVEKKDDVTTKPKKEKSKIPKKTEENGNNHEAAEKLIEKPKVVESEVAEDEYNYEEDFEDYSDDFEDDFEEEIEPIKPSANLLNQSKHQITEDTDETEMSEDEIPDRPKDSRGRLSKDNQKPDSALSTRASMGSRSTSQLSRFDFAKANKSELQLAGMSKATRRHRELLHLIELDFAHFDYFDMAPVRDYEFYIQNFGQSNRIQIQTQTGDDSEEVELQTDEVDIFNAWTQHPPTDAKGSGGDNETKTYKDESFTFDSEILNSDKLRNFVLRAGQLISDLLLESHDSGVENTSDFKPSSLSFSEQSAPLNCSSLIPNSFVTCVHFSPSHANWLATAHSARESENFDHDGVIIVWLVDKPTEPLYVLVSNLPAVACVFSPHKPNVVYAGLPDGCLLAYDLQESAALHKHSKNKNDNFVLRTPTYNTAFLCNSDTHSSAIVDITTLQSSRQSGSESSGYQVASLEQRGIVSIWTAITKSEAETSELDLGLRPGGKLKLVRTSTIKPSNVLYRSLSNSKDSASKRSDIQAFALAQSSAQLNQFFVATDTGFILHLVREGERTGPRALQPNLEAMADVTSLQISPFEPSTLLAGLSDGTISIYRVFCGKPVITLQLEKTKSSVICAKWSPSSPYKFFSLHSDAQFASWDLKHNPIAPIQLEELTNCISFDIYSVASDDSSTKERAKVFLAFAFNDGSVQVHRLKSKDRYSLVDGPKLLKILESY